jgi:uncharacterized membrane protein SirB2
MSYQVYKVLHLVGIIVVFMSLGGLILHTLNGGTKDSFKIRKFFSINHGLGLFISFVAGFGLLARTGASFSEGWVLVKFVIWLLVAGLSVIIYKKPKLAKVFWVVLIFFGGTAVYMVQNKPF